MINLFYLTILLLVITIDYLNIKNLKEGKHILTISGPSKENKFEKNSKTIQKTLVTIPFWYFPENSGTSSINNQEVVVDSLTNE